MPNDQSQQKPLLKGLKVVEMATWLFGPMSACILGEMGADVVKVEPHEGDPMRGLIHRLHDGVDWVFEIPNRNKRSVALNVRTPEGIDALRRLLSDADVFIVNLRRGALERLGIDYASIKAEHPRLIYAHATGYGTEGPDIDRPAFDELAYWARGGFMETLGPPDSEPIRLGRRDGRSAQRDESVGGDLRGAVSARVDRRGPVCHLLALWRRHLGQRLRDPGRAGDRPELPPQRPLQRLQPALQLVPLVRRQVDAAGDDPGGTFLGTVRRGD